MVGVVFRDGPVGLGAAGAADGFGVFLRRPTRWRNRATGLTGGGAGAGSVGAGATWRNRPGVQGAAPVPGRSCRADTIPNRTRPYSTTPTPPTAMIGGEVQTLVGSRSSNSGASRASDLLDGPRRASAEEETASSLRPHAGFGEPPDDASFSIRTTGTW